MIRLPGYAEIKAAHARIRPWIRKTPVIAIEADVTGVTDAYVALKLEGLQRTGSFKARGAFNAMLTHPVPAAGVVAASGGNHGAAVAYAAMQLGHPATIFVPETAPRVKIERLTRYGATVHQVGQTYAQAFEAAQIQQTASGARMLHAYDDPDIIAGQGTAALEFMAESGGLDTVIIAVGGGGLIGGVIAALMEAGVKVIAVESTGTPTLARALEAGAPVTVAVSGVAADALGASRIGVYGLALAQAHLHGMILVEDDEIRSTQRLLWDSLRVVAEPGGAAAFAALVTGRYHPAPGERVGVLVCGSNADLSML
jgi:threonine dehydratase